MQKHEQDGLCWYSFDLFDPTLVDHAIFTRKGGHSVGPYASFNLGGTNGDDPAAVLANHQSLFKVFGHSLNSRFDVWQVHGDSIRFTDMPRPLEQKHQPADGIFTNKTDVSLIMRFADCVPLLFHDPVKGAVGIVHAGWQGTLLKIGEKAVKEACAYYGSQASDWRVGIAPSICGQCYEVGEEVKTKFLKAFGEPAEDFFALRAGGLYLDLWKANEYTLRQAGVEHIEQSRLCTAEHLDEWYSYRKEKGVTGRFAVVIALKGNGKA